MVPTHPRKILGFVGSFVSCTLRYSGSGVESGDVCKSISCYQQRSGKSTNRGIYRKPIGHGYSTFLNSPIRRNEGDMVSKYLSTIKPKTQNAVLSASRTTQHFGFWV